jgi:transcriptional regulator with XRE-family HTH domain
MTGVARASGSHRNRGERLAKSFQKKKFRQTYFARQLKVFLAAQIRALRGERTQGEFGELIGKPQSVVSRLERESYGKVNLQTLIDIATRLDIALVIRFVRFDTFLEWTKDYSSEALAPASYVSEVKGTLDSALRGDGLSSNTDSRALRSKMDTAQESAQRPQDIRRKFSEGPEEFTNRERGRPQLEALPCA